MRVIIFLAMFFAVSNLAVAEEVNLTSLDGYVSSEKQVCGFKLPAGLTLLKAQDASKGLSSGTTFKLTDNDRSIVMNIVFSTTMGYKLTPESSKKKQELKDAVRGNNNISLVDSVDDKIAEIPIFRIRAVDDTRQDSFTHMEMTSLFFGDHLLRVSLLTKSSDTSIPRKYIEAIITTFVYKDKGAYITIGR